MALLAPSILSADFARLGAQIKSVEQGGAGMIHVDVMDGHFVPNITVGPLVVKAVRSVTNLPIDVHLMIENPDCHIDSFIKEGADLISIHQETVNHLHRTVEYIKSRRVKAGVAINPSTPITTIVDIIDDVDFVILMSVNPGFSNQTFINKILRKVEKVRSMIEKRGLPTKIEIDGGVKEGNILKVKKAGVDYIVAGSSIFDSPDPRDAVRRMLKILKE